MLFDYIIFMLFLWYFYGIFCPCRDFLSIFLSWICRVLTVSFLVVGVDHLITFLERTNSVNIIDLLALTLVGPLRNMPYWTP